MSGKMICVDQIPVLIEYRKVKNINLYIKSPDGQVLITAPRSVPEDRIREFVEKKEEWILKNQERIRKISQSQTELKKQKITTEQIVELEKKLRKYVDKWEPVIGVHATHWTLREMRTRWGSCTVDTGRIRINTRLAYYPDECLEYVIVHELCHLLETSHNQRFWSYVSEFIPDWKERKNKLKTEKIK